MFIYGFDVLVVKLPPHTNFGTPSACSDVTFVEAMEGFFKPRPDMCKSGKLGLMAELETLATIKIP